MDNSIHIPNTSYVQIPISAGMFCLIDVESLNTVNQIKWVFKPTKDRRVGYAQSKYGQMHRLILNAKDGQFVDHINGNGLDNRRCNLRICTQSQNNMNMRKRHGTSSIYKGVYFNKSSGKWIARLFINGKFIHLGSYKEEYNAAWAYNHKAVEMFGEFCKLNLSLPTETYEEKPLKCKKERKLRILIIKDLPYNFLSKLL